MNALLSMREALRKQRELRTKFAGSMQDRMNDNADLLTAIRQIASGGVRGAVAELSQETARRHRTLAEPFRAHMPLRMFGIRTMQVGTGSMGGYAVGSVPHLVPVTIESSVLSAAGAQTLMVSGGFQNAWRRNAGAAHVG